MNKWHELFNPLPLIVFSDQVHNCIFFFFLWSHSDCNFFFNFKTFFSLSKMTAQHQRVKLLYSIVSCCLMKIKIIFYNFWVSINKPLWTAKNNWKRMKEEMKFTDTETILELKKKKPKKKPLIQITVLNRKDMHTRRRKTLFCNTSMFYFCDTETPELQHLCRFIHTPVFVPDAQR